MHFENYDAILADVDRLHPAHRTVGNWSLAQICDHLAGIHDYSLGGRQAEFQKGRLFRATVGRIALRILLRYGFIPERQGNLGPRERIEFQDARRRLRQSLERIARQPMTAIHPIFGPLTRQQWQQFHLHHAAHHLSFMIPQGQCG
ncbi:MAG: DUF1569 domain-containing protein [Phycisphaerae bacterium]